MAGRSPLAHFITPGFAGADGGAVLEGRNEDFAVADLTRLCRLHDRLNRHCGFRFVNDNFDLDLRYEINAVLRAAVHFGVAFLPAEAADLRNGHARNALLDESILHVLQLEMANDGF